MAESDDMTTIAVTRDVASLIQQAVSLGRYASPSDLIRAALTDADPLEDWTEAMLARAWDDGIASGPGTLGIDDIKREALRRAGRSPSGE